MNENWHASMLRTLFPSFLSFSLFSFYIAAKYRIDFDEKFAWFIKETIKRFTNLKFL